jgi:hypothetical protein
VDKPNQPVDTPNQPVDKPNRYPVFTTAFVKTRTGEPGQGGAGLLHGAIKN